MTKERMTKEQRRQERERQVQSVAELRSVAGIGQFLNERNGLL